MKSLLRLCLLVLVLSFGLFLASHYVMELNSSRELSQVIQKEHWIFGLWHYGLYALMLIIWPYFIKFIGFQQKWQPQTIAYLSKQRVKLLGLFVIIEIFLVHNLLAYLIAWM